MYKFDFESRKQDRQELLDQLAAVGCKQHKSNIYYCKWHDDSKPSAGIKKGSRGWFFHCFVCGITFDVWDIEAEATGLSLAELLKEKTGKTQTTAKWQEVFPTVEALIDSIDAIDVEEVNNYTNPETGNIDLLTIRYLPRGEKKKGFAQAHQTPKGFIRKRPSGALPLFNRIRVQDADVVVYVEGEKCVRELTILGFTATTGSGGSLNAEIHDYSPLAGKKVILWADNDAPGKAYMSQVKDKLLLLEPPPSIFSVDVENLELPEGGDVVDLCVKVKTEGGNTQDCKDYIESLIEDAREINLLQCLEDHLEDMREGRYINLPIKDFPIITNEARMLLNKRIGIIYGTEGFGKTLFIGKTSDDLLLDGHKVARLQLEDEMEQHLLRSLAQQSQRSELVNDVYHKENKLESKLLYEQFKPTLNTIAGSITAGEHEEWDSEKILNWIEAQLATGKELVVVDPISVISTDKIWLTSHRLMWGLKKILSKYPTGRVVLISHPDSEGNLSGGRAYRRFSHCMLILNRYKKPKEVELIDIHGEIKFATIDASIGIVKARYGKGTGMEVAVKLEGSTLQMTELGIILRELDKKKKSIGKSFDDMDDDGDL